MSAAYEVHRRDGRLPATYEVVFGQAWAPTGVVRPAGAADRVSLEDMKRQLQTRRRQ
jgi:malonyl-CoA O-methyltransferase